MKFLLSVFLCIVIEIRSDDDSGWSLDDSPLVVVHPCNGSTDIQLMYEPYRSPEEENQYNLWIHKKFPKNTVIKMKFDKGATVSLSNQSTARIDLDKSDEHAFKIRFFKSHEGICLHVQGCKLGLVPYIKRVNINTKEYCEDHVVGFLDSYIEGYKLQAQSSCAELKVQQNGSCGKRQNLMIPLSVQGESQRYDWPWHVALFHKVNSNRSRYMCGGTLISSYYILTAAHCVFRSRSNETANLTVALGKYYYEQHMELGTDEKEIEKIIYHTNFNKNNLDNDIALLKMKTEAKFTINIQPACLWNANANERLTSKPIMGTIVGWGYDDDNHYPTKLIQAQIPMIPDIICLRNNPTFYSFHLNARKFCGGILNEALACNGDSGGGFHVFIPDKVGDNSTTGSWYIRGLISSSVANADFECSADHYTVFIDVEKYTEWILSHI